MAIDTKAGFRPSEEYLVEDDSAPLVRLCITFLILETFFMVLLYVSRWISKAEKATWYMIALMTAGYMVAVTKITTAILMVNMAGTGRHLIALEWPTIELALKFSLVMQIICPLTTSLTKLGILCLFDQIIGQVSVKSRWVIRITFAVTVAIIVIQIIIPLANCNPLSKWWNPMGPGSCAFSGLSLWRYLGIPNMIVTIVMICIPIPTLWKLNTTMSTKFGLAVILSVCLMGVAAAIMRVKAFLDVTNFDDITYENITPLCWTITEAGIYLVAGVLMTLRPLMLKLLKDVPLNRILSATFRSSGRWGSHMEIKEEKALLQERRWYKTGPTGTVVATTDEEAQSIDDQKR